MLIKRYIPMALFCQTLWIAGCATPPNPPEPLTALELARMGIVPTDDPNKTQGSPIVELSAPAPSPLREVNQTGALPDWPDRQAQGLDLSQLDSNATIELNFEQGELRQVIETIASALEISTVIDPSIADKVTLRTAPENKLKREDLWPLLQLLLVDAGVSMERKGNVYHFKKEGLGAGLPGTIGEASSVLGRNSAEVLQITPLRYIAADAAINVLTPLLQPTGRVLSLPSLNIIGIIATPDRIERVNQLLKIIDADPFRHRGMRLFRLQNSKAAEVQADLDKILQAMSGNNIPIAYQVLSLERINALLVIAPPNSGFKEVEMWVNILDERSEESTEQVFIYNVRNLDAKDLASTLSSVFESDQDEDRLGQTEETTEETTPVSSFFQTENGVTIVENTPSPTPNATPTGAVSAQLMVKVTADEKTNSLIVRATPRDYRQLLETIRILDRAPKEVMVNVVIAEVTLNEATQHGVDWQGILGNDRGTVGFNTSPPGGNLPANVSASTDNTTISVGGLTGFTLNYLSGGLNALLNLITQNSDVRVLSRPSVLVRNNEEARIEVGSREPIPGATNVTSTGQLVNSGPQYESVGVILSVEPRINDDGIINLKISQEISSLGPTRSGNPSFDQRKVQTLVVVRNGTPIVIGGLIQDRYNNSQEGIPGLNRIPLFGDTLFSSRTKNYQRTELVLIMVPEIVNPELDNSPIVQQFKARMKAIGDLLNREIFYLYGLDRLRVENP
ncbi:type II secretion system secretin GspD [Thioflexithrix psekupsensis]|uniref:Type II secretion system protein GspD n=1 Tax=Thioflexithrix psekupsensis TaxID=1570016 RepID=A0A251X616_9GAMM|nr:type II secretion system secretin GspD [Thioflexithrix psekupsensis]OUD13186.1 type II secretion system protein GspD [Thioflexithrix psekupsensis]